MVVVSVTVVTDVVTEVVVGGAEVWVVWVVVGAAVVVGVTVVVTVVGGGGGAAVVLGAGAAVWVVGAGADDSEAGEDVGADDVVGARLLEVTAGLSVVPELVYFTTAKTSRVSTAAVSTPRPIRTAGR